MSVEGWIFRVFDTIVGKPIVVQLVTTMLLTDVFVLFFPLVWCFLPCMKVVCIYIGRERVQFFYFQWPFWWSDRTPNEFPLSNWPTSEDFMFQLSWKESVQTKSATLKTRTVAFFYTHCDIAEASLHSGFGWSLQKADLFFPKILGGWIAMDVPLEARING